MSTWVTGTTVVENSVDTENLTSNVTITLIVGWNGGSWASDNPYYYINVNGSRVKSGTANFNTGQATTGSQTIATWTGNVPHESDGTGSMTWAVGYEGIYAGEGNYSTASGTKTLTPIEIPDPDPPTPTGDGNYLDKTGLAYFFGKLKAMFAKKDEVVTSVNGQTGDVIVEGGEGGGTSNNMVTLWTNPNPTSAFAQQTISLDLSDYDAILIECNTAGSGTGTTTQLGFVGTTVRLMAEIYQIHRRLATINSDGITFGNNYYLPAYANGNESVSNGYLIPTKIIGLKIKGVGKSGQLELAWSNPSPTASFAPQTITLKDSYPVVFVVSTYSASDDITSKNGTVSTIISGYRGQVIAWNENMTWTYGRSCVLNGSSLTVGDARWLIQSSSASAIQNDTCIPKFVFGLKTVAPKVGKTLLWTNPSPTANFNAQTVTLSKDASDYDAFMIEAIYATTTGYKHTTTLLNDGETQSFTAPRFASGSGHVITWRDITISGNTAVITIAGYITGSTDGTGNNYCIPLKIYGINFSGSPSTPEYRSGDTETLVSTTSGEPYALMIGGLLTSATKSIYFTIQTPRSMAGVNPSITSLRINPRHSGGGYMIGSSYVSGGTQVVGASGYTVTAHKTDDYHITITVARSSTYNGSNNTPCMVQVDELKLSFA